MKKFILFFISLFFALFITEIIVAYVISYPKYGVSSRVFGLHGFSSPQNVYLPYSEYWTVEGKNKVYKRNNLGFPGADVDTGLGHKYIYVVGNSYVQAYEVEPDSMATSILNSRIKNKYKDFSVLNLGRGDQDVYDSYFKCLYYEKYFHPALVFLILDNTNKEVLLRHNKPLNFQVSDNFGKAENSFLLNAHNYFRNKSSLINLVAKYVYDNQNLFNERNDKTTEDVNPYTKSEDLINLSDDLFLCINEFNKKYGKKFVLVSIIASSEINSRLNDFCTTSGINFTSGEINIAKYKLSGWGHLTNEGNRLFGELLYESFVKYYSE
jgi:hypothetical protein